MHFINTTKNSINLSDIGMVIPFFEDFQEQYIDSNKINRSPMFQKLCVNKDFLIKKIEDSRIEQNLLAFQKKEIKFPEISPVKVNFKGHFSGNAGFSKANRNLLYALTKLGIKVDIDPMSEILGLSAAETAYLQKFRNIPDPDSIFIHSTIPSFYVKNDAKYSILYTTIESSSVPNQFIEACSHYDEIWVTSDFCKSILQPLIDKEILVMPCSINVDLYNEKGKKHSFTPPLKKFKFINVATWDYRKGYDALLKAYLLEFSKDEDVSLLFITPYTYKNNKVIDKVGKDIKEYIEKYNPNNPHIARCGYPIIENDLPKVYRACDAFVLPSRGEGFGLPYLEASMCGLPVIATNYSGHSMFLNENNSFLVNIDKLNKSEGNTQVHYWNNQLFPQLTSDDFITSLRKEMRYVFDNKDVAKYRNNQLQDDILKRYSQNMIGELIKKRLEIIWALIQ